MACFEVAVEVAFIQGDVPHDHHVCRVTKDPAQPLDLASTAQQVLGEGVAKAEATVKATEKTGYAADGDRRALRQDEQPI